MCPPAVDYEGSVLAKASWERVGLRGVDVSRILEVWRVHT